MKYIITLLIIGIIAIAPIIAYTTKDSIQFIVNDKERIVTGSGDSLRSKYLIYTDNGVYQNTDTIFYFKFDSSDVQNEAQVGSKCEANVYGFRVPFLSWYKNIINITCTSLN